MRTTKGKKAAVCFLTGIFVAASFATLQTVQPEPVTAEEAPVKIMAMGDSITDGYINGTANSNHHQYRITSNMFHYTHHNFTF